ncbi:hypothetical protein ACXJJ3_32920 [Kribbella sp. WER1]
MSLFLATAALLAIVAVLIAADARHLTTRDSLGLRAARAEVVADIHHRAAQERNRDLMYLRLSGSLISGRSATQMHQEEDR